MPSEANHSSHMREMHREKRLKLENEIVVKDNKIAQVVLSDEDDPGQFGTPIDEFELHPVSLE